uniref:N-acetyltransferase 6 (inferred by orthology to a human protein) n=1 Tax=Strongyloides venezuelensis TaxID=75913 RepID=A0A0K0FXN3_STRVS
MEIYKLVPLATCPHLANEVVLLLNSEWPRSDTVRQRSISKSCNMEPPMSLVLFKDESQNIPEVIGYAKLCEIPKTDESACWVESVIIKSTLRGRKLGSLLMNELEKIAIKFNYDVMYLSTHDKKEFYEKCGFEECSPVSNVGANSELFKKFSIKTSLITDRRKGYSSQSNNMKILSQENNCTVVKNNIPTPPLLPSLSLLTPPQTSSSSIYNETATKSQKIYMKKFLRQ